MPKLHIRCKACKRHLAGPLSLKEDLTDHELDFLDYLEVQQIAFPNERYFAFDYRTPHDLLIHPQWYEDWKWSWDEEIVTGAVLRPTHIHNKHSDFGCCGHVGKVNCACGEILGTGFADCYAPQWILLYAEKIERSDRADGLWTIFSDANAHAQWHEATGKLLNGLREGEWEVWYNEFLYRQIEKRNKERKIVSAQKEEYKRELIRYEYWQNGKLISHTDE